MNRGYIGVCLGMALGAGCSAGAHGASPTSYTTSTGGMAPLAPTAEAAEATVSITIRGIEAEVSQEATPAAILTASSVGDHDRRGPYLEFLARHPHEVRSIGLDTSRRVRLRVTDGAGHPLRGASVAIDGRPVGTTFADGVFDLYPGVLGLGEGTIGLDVAHDGRTVRALVDLPAQGDGEDLLVRLDGVSAHAASRLEVAFLVDVTGSMEDELRYVNHEIGGIVARVRDGAAGLDVRVGAAFYRDRGDAVPLAKIDFTRDVGGFARAMSTVSADGGGDYPEDLDAGLETALHRLSWSSDDAVRVLVLITDAPAQPYRTQFRYHEALVEAARRGIRILPVAASGADRTVETLLRALGACTGAPYVYLTDHSGVGAPHLEADTERVRVEHFSLLLTRLLLADLAGLGMHEPGYGGIPDFAQ